MIRIYTAPSCASCRKVKAWLKEHDIPYVEKNIFSTILREDELRELLERSENGTDDIISKRSKIIKENKVDIEDMSTNELIQLIGTSLDKKSTIWNVPSSCIRGVAKLGDHLHLPLNSERLQKLTENYIVSNEKIKRGINKKMPVSTEEGLIRTFRSFSNL